MRITLLTAIIAIAVSLNFSVQAQSLTGLSKDEISKYNSLKTDPAAAKSYWNTRCYLLSSRKVESGGVAAERLPRMPMDYNADYNTDAEQKIVNLAVIDSIAARLDSTKAAAPPMALCAP